MRDVGDFATRFVNHAPTARDAIDALARAILDGEGTDENAGAGLAEAAALIGVNLPEPDAS